MGVQIATVAVVVAALVWLALVARLRPAAGRLVLDDAQMVLLAPGLAVVFGGYLAYMIAVRALPWAIALALAAAVPLFTYSFASTLQRLKRQQPVTLRRWLLFFLGKGS